MRLCDECSGDVERYLCRACYEEKNAERDRYRKAIEEALKALRRWTIRRACCEVQRILAKALKEEPQEEDDE